MISLSKCLLKVKKIYKNPWSIFQDFNHLLKWMPDTWYLKGYYRAKLGQKLNLKNPQTYTEKLQWLKIHDRNPLYTQLVDKYLVREYIKQRIGEKYLIPLLGVWDSFDEIDFDTLPNQFVLKTNHDSGTIILCRDKSTFDKEAARKKINDGLRRNHYYYLREWPYKNVPRKIIAEQYMENKSDAELTDYKFFTFDGKVKALVMVTDRSEDIKFDFFDEDFHHLPFTNLYPNSCKTLVKPSNFDEMKRLSEILSKGIPHLRVDLYEINGAVYFGELTIYYGGGITMFKPKEWDKIFGDWLQLPSIK